MAKKSLANFCVVVSKNRRFGRSELPFEKSSQPHLPGAACCCLSHFRTIRGSKEVFPLDKRGIDDEALWAILVHEPVRVTNRSPERSARVGGQWHLTYQEEGRYVIDESSSHAL
jgi:hypothetical protein